LITQRFNSGLFLLEDM